MSKKMLKIFVITSILNCSRFIRQCIESVIAKVPLTLRGRVALQRALAALKKVSTFQEGIPLHIRHV